MPNLEIILAAFGGGVFASLLSGTGAFIFVGFIGLAGIATSVASGNTYILTDIAFGPFFGPHIAFAGAVAAAAYAANKKQYLSTGTDINTPLVFTQDPIVLCVGGLFGVLGLFLNNLYITILPPIDTVACTVATSGIIVRFLFGKSGLIGNSVLATKDQESRYAISIHSFIFNLIIAISIGAIVSIAAINLQIPEIGFTISAISLIFLYTNPGGGPVTHHLSITAGVAAVQTGNVYLGIIASLIAYVIFEFLGVRTFNKYQDTHIDPPAVAITITSLIVMNLFPTL